MHTKTPRRIPTLVYGLGAGLALLAYMGPTAYARISDRINPPAAVTPAQIKTSPNTKIEGGQLVTTTTNTVTNTPVTPAQNIPGLVAAPALAGCVASANRCQCYDTTGARVETEKEQCTKALDLGATAKTLDNFDMAQTPSETRPSDIEVLQAIRANKPLPLAYLGNN